MVASVQGGVDAGGKKPSLSDVLGEDAATEKATVEKLIGRPLTDEELGELHDLMQKWGISADDPQWVMTRALAGVVYLCKSLPAELQAASQEAQARHLTLLAEQSRATGLAIIRGLVPAMVQEASMEMSRGRWRFWATLTAVNLVTVALAMWGVLKVLK